MTVIRPSTIDESGRRRLRRAVRRGGLVPIAPDALVDADALQALDTVGRHLLVARAVAPRLPPRAVFSHATAAVIRGWPWYGDAPDRVHVVDLEASAARVRTATFFHARRALVHAADRRFAGVPVVSSLDAAVALAVTAPIEQAFIAIDGAMRTDPFDPAAFLASAPAPPARGSRRAERIAALLDARHESAGESFTALRLDEIQLGGWIPQHEFRYADGTIDRVDFWNPERGIVVEFDGRQKYEDPTMAGGRSADDRLWQEKIREDRIRALPPVRTLVRPRWWHLAETDRLLALFREHGVHVY